MPKLDQKGIISFGLIVIVLIILAIAVGIYLTSNRQIFKSKASSSYLQALEIKDANGNSISCDTSTNPPTCVTPTLEISVRVKDPNALNQ